MRHLLEAADSPVHLEQDPALDWDAIWTRIDGLVPTLDRIAGQTFAWDTSAQDATFVADLGIFRKEQRKPDGVWCRYTVFGLRFSGFGWLFTTWSWCPLEGLSDEVAERLVQAVTAAGFHHVPEATLDEAYTGQHPGFAGSTWRIRFFDYW
jgi:hypothetical protein